MIFLVRHLLKKTRSGGYAQREERIDAAVLRIGRGADCELHLTDPRIRLHHLELSVRSNAQYLDAAAGVEFLHNDVLTGSAILTPGDRIQIGPYDMLVLPLEEGVDAAFSLDYARPLISGLSSLRHRSDTKLNRVGLGLRGWTWTLFSCVLLLGLVAPLASVMLAPQPDSSAGAPPPDTVLSHASSMWLSGPFSRAHSRFGSQCSLCHEKAFVRVTNESCISCHDDAAYHADPVAFPVMAASTQRCASCHKEHTGGEDMIVSGNRFCTDCHGRLAEKAPNSVVPSFSGFESHPQFHINLPDASGSGELVRVALDRNAAVTMTSTLKFPHKSHLREEGMRNPRGERVTLTCASCHMPEPGGTGMQPARFETACASCHSLQFEPLALERAIPHGPVARARQFVEDTYASLALRGGFGDTASDTPPSVRRLIGTSLDEAQRLEALAWAEMKAAQVLEGRYGRGLCAQCHVLKEGSTGADWDITPIQHSTRWFTAANFTHHAHRTETCTTCHAAPISEWAEDILLPGVETCQTCHGDTAGQGRLETTCIDCHRFHRDGMQQIGSGHDHNAATEWRLFAQQPE